MLGKARLATILPILVVLVFFLQGCPPGGGGGSDDGGGNQVVVPRVALATTTGSTFLIADGASSLTVRVTVTNASGQGLPNRTVTFTTTAGSLALPAGVVALRANGSTSVVATTDADGVAQATLTSSTTVETATVSARVETGSNTSVAPSPLTIAFISAIPVEISLRAIPATVALGTTSTILATVTAAGNVPVEGVQVTFSFQTNNSGGLLSTTSGTTNTDGEVSVTYAAGALLSTDTIRGSVSGAGGTITNTVEVSVQTTTVSADSLELLVSSPQMDSDGSEKVTLTALVRDINNNFVASVAVTFAATSGGIQVTSGTTDASGRATAVLETAGDPTNRLIDLTALAGTLISANTVTVTGTTITLSGTNTLVLNQTTTLSILLRDSAGNGIPGRVISLSSDLGNTLSAPTVTTNFAGQAEIEVTATVAGTDTIRATALGATGTLALLVSPATFAYTTPASGAEVNLNTDQTVSVHFELDGVDQAGAVVNFTATRGTFVGATSGTTDAAGNTQVVLRSNNAGPAVITATCPDPNPTTIGDACDDEPSTQIEIEFIAITPTSLILQASPTSLGVNTGSSTSQQSIITAIVRDTDGNLVKNMTVNFKLTDVSGGSIFPASAVTDSFGRASTVYTAGAAPSAQDGVIIDAEVTGTVGCVPTDDIPTGPCDRVVLTVAQRSLFVTLGTGNTIQALSDNLYGKPYSVLVTDANGNPITGAKVELNVSFIRYQKGFYTLFFDEFELCVGWGKFLTVSSSSTFPNADNADQACDNEDINGNGILTPGEDINNNGTLQPGNVATAPTSVTTDASGFAEFVVTYAKEFTWVEIELEARTTVDGSEASSRARFFLPGLVTDFNNCDVTPPGVVSPYGVATTCGCDELDDATCPTTSGLGPIIFTILAGVVPVPAGGGTVTFAISGGSQTSYTVGTDIGTLRNNVTLASGAAIVVDFGETFNLIVPGPSGAARTITLNAIDLVTGVQQSTTVAQD
jgi:hypothetical protein